MTCRGGGNHSRHDVPLVVFHSWVAAYLSPEGQRELVQAIGSWPTADGALPLRRVAHRDAGTSDAAVTVAACQHRIWPRRWCTSAPTARAPVRLADIHPHGKWLQWWPSPKDPMEHLGGPVPGRRRR